MENDHNSINQKRPIYIIFLAGFVLLWIRIILDGGPLHVGFLRFCLWTVAGLYILKVPERIRDREGLIEPAKELYSQLRERDHEGILVEALVRHRESSVSTLFLNIVSLSLFGLVLWGWYTIDPLALVFSWVVEMLGIDAILFVSGLIGELFFAMFIGIVFYATVAPAFIGRKGVLFYLGYSLIAILINPVYLVAISLGLAGTLLLARSTGGELVLSDSSTT